MTRSDAKFDFVDFATPASAVSGVLAGFVLLALFEVMRSPRLDGGTSRRRVLFALPAVVVEFAVGAVLWALVAGARGADDTDLGLLGVSAGGLLALATVHLLFSLALMAEDLWRADWGVALSLSRLPQAKDRVVLPGWIPGEIPFRLLLFRNLVWVERISRLGAAAVVSLAVYNAGLMAGREGGTALRSDVVVGCLLLPPLLSSIPRLWNLAEGRIPALRSVGALWRRGDARKTYSWGDLIWTAHFYPLAALGGVVLIFLLTGMGPFALPERIDGLERLVSTESGAFPYAVGVVLGVGLALFEASYEADDLRNMYARHWQ